MNKGKISYKLKSRTGILKEIIIKFSFGYKEVNNLTGKKDYKPLRYNSGVKTTAENWDYVNHVPRLSTDFMKVLQVQEKLETLYKSLKDQGKTVTPDLLKSELDILLGRTKAEIKVTRVADFIFDHYLEKEEKKEKEKFQFAETTRKNYRLLRNMILDFEKVTGNHLIAEKIDKETFLAFQKMCQNHANKNNYAWTFMKNLRAAMRAIGRKYKVTVFDPAKEMMSNEVISHKLEDKIFFDFEEIQKIIKYQPTTHYMREIKAILITFLFSGARWSDIYKVVPKETYQGSDFSYRYAHFITTKNPTEVVVPFLKPLEDEWAKTGRETLMKVESSEFNESVKDLCKLAGFNSIKKLAYTDSDGKKQFEEKAHYKFVSSHIGRRSFVSNFINVISPMLISKITGHQFKMKDVIYKYNKITPRKSSILFMKFLKKLQRDKDWKEEFPIRLA